jgi:hypothetical protein
MQVLEVFDAADSTAGIAAHLPNAPRPQEAAHTFRIKRYVDQKPVIAVAEVDVPDAACVLDYSLCKREAVAEVHEIVRRCHHHRMRKAAKAKGDRHFFGY